MEQRTPEWFAARKGCITASIVGGLLDCAPYMTKEDAFRTLVRSCHDLPSEFEGNIATEYGTANESTAVIAYELKTGNTVKPAGFVTWDNWTGFVAWDNWIGASPDGYVGDDGLIEVKCPFGKRKDNPPEFKSIHDMPHYYAQIQVQLFVTGRGYCDFWQWSPHGSRLETVRYNGELIGEIIPTLLAIWQDAQNADVSDYEGPKRKVIDTPEAAKLVAEYDEISEAIENAQARKKDIVARFVSMSGGKDARLPGKNLTLVKRAGSVSYAKALNAYAPDADLEPYRGKPSESWQVK
jgi:putative phage-type endonuclease